MRKADVAFEDVSEYPQHTACFQCHNQQFFTGAAPVICSVCHTNASPRNAPRYQFPSLGEGFYATKKGLNFSPDFKLNFPHDKHIEIVGGIQPDSLKKRGVSFISTSFGQEDAAQAGKSCNVCHQTAQPQGTADEEYVTKPPKGLPEDAFWLKKGAFKTVPLTHDSCFTCHSRESGQAPAPSDCNACHKLAPSGEQSHSDFDPRLAALMGITDNLTLMRWRKREAGAFRHEMVSHAELACASCHNVAQINTLDEKTKKVKILTCGGAGCHITATADEGGILNYVVEQRKTDPAFQCTKCHIVFGKEPIPQSHLDALEIIKNRVSGQ